MMVISPSARSSFMLNSVCSMDSGNILNRPLIFVLDISTSLQDCFEGKHLYVWYGAVSCVY